MTVGLVEGVGVGIGIRFAVFVGFLSVVLVIDQVFWIVFCAAHGIIRSIPFRIEAAFLSPLTCTISSTST